MVDLFNGSKIGTYHTTTNYEMFKKIESNRKIAFGKNYKQLKELINKWGGNIEPILVNNDYEVIDGQHRLAACSELGLPVTYKVQKVSESESQELMTDLNISKNNWKPEDYVNKYARLGYPSYIALEEAYKKWTSDEFCFLSKKFTMNVIGEAYNITGYDFNKRLASGDFVFDPAGANLLTDVVKIWMEQRNVQVLGRGFVKSLKAVIADNKKVFDIDVFLHKLSFRRLRVYSTAAERRAEIVEIYNWNSRKAKNRIK